MQSYVDQMKQNYASDDKWNEALQAVGMTEDEYKSNIKTSLLQQGLMKTFEGDDPSDEDVLSYAQTYISSFDGAKRSSISSSTPTTRKRRRACSTRSMLERSISPRLQDLLQGRLCPKRRRCGLG